MSYSFETVSRFEKQVARFFGAPHGIAVDSATHGIELSMRYLGERSFKCPTHTYLSIPFLKDKLNIDRYWVDDEWADYYYLTPDIIDAAVLWQKNSYVPKKFMSISFQYQKHLSVGRGGMILTDNEPAAIQLKKMVYDGRIPGIPWREQNIDTVGYHYYMTPETAGAGLYKIERAIDTEPRKWSWLDYPNLTEMEIFKHRVIEVL